MAKKSEKRVTMADVARAAGVSKPTVSAILKDNVSLHTGFSEETKEKVLKVAEKLKYRPNRTARSFFQNRHGALGILIDDFYTLQRGVLKEIISEAAKYDQIILLEEIDDEGELPRFIAEDMVDGIIVSEILPGYIRSEIDRLEIPLVRVEIQNPSTGNDVYLDVDDGVRQVVAHFKNMGKKNPAFFYGSVKKPTGIWNQRKYESLKKIAKEEGMGDAFNGIVYFEDKSREPERAGLLYDAFPRYLKENPEIDAVMLPSGSPAVPFYEAVRAVGKKIPDDISVVSLQGGRGGRRLRPPLTCLNPKWGEAGRTVLKLINNLIDGSDNGDTPHKIGYNFWLGES